MLGLTDRDREGSFAWSNGAPTRFANWSPGEPNDYEGKEDCTELHVSRGLWNDLPCDVPLPFLCEAD